MFGWCFDFFNFNTISGILNGFGISTDSFVRVIPGKDEV